MKQFITAAVFSYPHEIAILKHLLEEAGINYYFENETMADILPMHSYASGGIKLQVHPNDLETVNYILEKLNTSGNNLKIV